MILTEGTVIPIRTKAEALELKGIGDSLATRVSSVLDGFTAELEDRRDCNQQPLRSSLL